MKKNLNGKDVEMTAEEQTEFEQYQSKLQEQETETANQLKAKEDLKTSAKAKLIAGKALTEEEANTIVL